MVSSSVGEAGGGDEAADGTEAVEADSVGWLVRVKGESELLAGGRVLAGRRTRRWA